MNHPLRFTFRTGSILMLLAFTFNPDAFAQRNTATGKTCDPADKRIERKYDRFSDRGSVVLNPIIIYDAAEERIELNANYHPRYQSDLRYVPRSAILEFNITTRKHNFTLTEFDLLFLVDGKRVAPSSANRLQDFEFRRPAPGTVRPQKVLSSADLDTLLLIGTGKRVEVKLGEMEFTPTAQALAALLAFADCAKATAANSR